MIKGSVKIIYHNDNADSIIASAGRISTTKGTANEIYEESLKKDNEDNIRLIGKILSSGHTSVLEHCNLNLSFDNVSVFVEQFMIEFRLASFTVKSRRYVDFGKMGYVMPDFTKYKERADEIRSLYQSHMEYLFKEYNDLIECGIPKEDARFVLPYSFRSNFYCTMNARELVKVVNEMVWGRGKNYPELVMLGESLIEQCRDMLPFLKFGMGNENKKGLPFSVAGDNKRTDISDAPVTLLNGPENPEEIICRAAMLSSGDPNRLSLDVKDVSMQKSIIKDIIEASRKRELEQVHFTILFNHVSLAGVTHLVRHRMQSIIVPVYIHICDYKKYILPESIVKAGLKERYEAIFERSEKNAEALSKAGFSEFDKAYLLLSGMTVPVLTTMNANELITFLRLRCCNRAQWEIREDARKLLQCLREKYPVLFSLYGPTCYMSGMCPEGKMTCGQITEIKRMFSVEDC